MSAGLLQELVALDAPTQQPDGYGGQEVGWSEEFTSRAQFVWERGGEGMEAARLSGRSVYKVKLRSSIQSRAVNPGWRLRDVRRVTEYNVRSVDAIADRAWVYLTVESGVAV